MIRGTFFRWSLISLSVLFAVLLPGMSASGMDSEESTGDIGFYVRAVLPDSQLDDSLSYFNLRTEPGQTQSIQVEVVNESGTEIMVDLAAISASTNRNGIIDYKTPGIKDKSLKIAFSEITTAEDDIVVIAADSTRIVTFDITVPAIPYDGVILGGLVFTRQDSGNEPETDATIIKNRYSYVIGVVLSDNDIPVQPEFELDSIEARLVNYYPAVVHQIRNVNPAIAKNIDLDIEITDQQGNVVADITKTAVNMAPNSVMPLAVTITGTDLYPGQLPAGEYISEIRLRYEEREVVFKEAFTLGRVETEILNAAIPEAQFGKKQLSPWVIALVSGIITFLLMWLLFFIFSDKRRKRQ